jgi:hypothetical protein
MDSDTFSDYSLSRYRQYFHFRQSLADRSDLATVDFAAAGRIAETQNWNYYYSAVAAAESETSAKMLA